MLTGPESATCSLCFAQQLKRLEERHEWVQTLLRGATSSCVQMHKKLCTYGYAYRVSNAIRVIMGNLYRGPNGILTASASCSCITVNDALKVTRKARPAQATASPFWIQLWFSRKPPAGAEGGARSRSPLLSIASNRRSFGSTFPSDSFTRQSTFLVSENTGAAIFS